MLEYIANILTVMFVLELLKFCYEMHRDIYPIHNSSHTVCNITIAKGTSEEDQSVKAVIKVVAEDRFFEAVVRFDEEGQVNMAGELESYSDDIV